MTSQLLVGILSSVLATLVVSQAIKMRQIGGLRKIRIFEPQHGQFNSKFYNYFVARIDDAKEEIVVTGEGFEFKGADGPAIAERYHEAMRSALVRGVHVVRFQTLRPLNPRWAALMSSLLDNFNDRFHLYVVDNGAGQDIASVCVIDESRRSNVVEWMLSAERDLEDSSVRVASTGLFIHGRKDLARAMKINVMAMKGYANVMAIKSSAELATLIERT